MNSLLSAKFAFILLHTATAAAWATDVAISWVPVGNPGNPPNPSGIGAVAYPYSISKYEVTIAQYCAFLNAVAASDFHGLYDPEMAANANIQGIARAGAAGSYSYTVLGDGERPITRVSWKDAARFANWIMNGQGNASTETGAYDLSLPSNLSTAQVRQPGATIALPTHHEWYKAGFYDPAKNGGSGGYWDYAFRSDTLVNNSVSANYYDGDYAVPQSLSTGGNLLTPVGHYANSPSAYGTFDQTGNVSEFIEAVETSVTGQFRRSVGGHYTSGGGGWSLTPLKGLEITQSSPDLPPFGNHTGFRLVQVAPAPALFAGSPPSGLVTTWVGGYNPGPNQTYGPNYSPNSVSYSIQREYLTVPGLPAMAEGFFSNSNPALPHNSSAKGTVSLGKLHFNVAQIAPYDNLPNSTVTSGGWEETFLFNSPGLAGTQAWVLCKFEVEAHLHALQPPAGSSFSFAVRTDGPAFTGSEPGYVTGSSTSLHPGFVWSHGNYPFPPTPAIKSYVEEIVVSVPIIFGQQIRIQFYAVATAGFWGSSGTFATAKSEAHCKLKWNGIQGVINAGGQYNTSFTIHTVSGTPYSQQLPVQKLPIKNLTVVPLNGGYQLTWPTWPGESFVYETSPDMGTWTPQPALPAATGDTMSFQWNPPPGSTRGFLQVFEEF